MVGCDRSFAVSFGTQECCGIQPGENDRVRAKLGHNWWFLLAKPAKLSLTGFSDPRVVPRPPLDLRREIVDLIVPRSILFGYIPRPNDEQVHITAGTPIAASRRAEQQDAHRNDLPGLYRMSNAIEQLRSHSSQHIDGRRCQVFTIERVQQGPAGLLAVDQSVLDESIQHVEHPTMGGTSRETCDFSARQWSDGAGQDAQSLAIEGWEDCSVGVGNMHSHGYYTSHVDGI
jgi:hypothetical protein